MKIFLNAKLVCPVLLTSTTTNYPLAYYMNSKGIGGKQIMDSCWNYLLGRKELLYML